MTIVDRIRELARSQNTSITKLEVQLGFANGTIGKWNHAKKNPPLEKVTAIADVLNTTAEYLYTGEQTERDTFSSEEEALISAFRKLTRENQNAVMQIVSQMALTQKNSAVSDMEAAR